MRALLLLLFPETCHARPNIADMSPVLCECDTPYLPDPLASDEEDEDEVFEFADCCIGLLLSWVDSFLTVCRW